MRMYYKLKKMWDVDYEVFITEISRYVRKKYRGEYSLMLDVLCVALAQGAVSRRC